MAFREAPSGIIGLLVQELGELPGIGPKSAERIAHYLLNGKRNRALALSAALRSAVELVRACIVCHNWTEDQICPICRDSRRDPSSLCVVETPKDLATIERAGTFRGRYHVLGGKLAPLDNVGPDELHLDSLVKRVKQGDVRELILATSPTLEGDGTALFIANMLVGTELKITRLARGIPSGSSLDYVNAQMLTDALEGRRSL